MYSIKAIIFDMDGVLADTEGLSKKFWKEAFENYGYHFEESLFPPMIGKNIKLVKMMLLEYYGERLPVDDIVDDRTKRMTAYIDNHRAPTKIGVPEIISYLKNNGYKTAVATSTHREAAEKILKDIGVYKELDAIVCGDEIKKSKPDPEMFLTAAAELGVNEGECIVIEDSPVGVEAAYNAGIKVINVPDFCDIDDIIRERTIAVCKDLLDVKKYLEENCTR